MGNNLSAFPVTAQDIVLSYLNVTDAKQLMSAHEFFQTQVRQNRPFWLKRARILYAKDPAVFLRLRNPDLFPRHALIEHVCTADTLLQDTIGQIANGEAIEGVYEFEDKVVCMALDEKACLLVIHLHNYRTEIFNLLRFGDPPLRIIDAINIEEVVIHGDLLFYREPNEPETYHADVLNWRINIPMASLEPRMDHVSPFFAKSDEFLAVYDDHAHCARAYPLVVNGYEKDAIPVLFPNDADFHDMAVREDIILVILRKRGTECLAFKSFKIRSNAILQHFQIHCPSKIVRARIAYPHILLAQPPPAALRHTVYNVYGSRILIPGNNQRVFGNRQLLASNLIESPTNGDFAQFVFISDGLNERTDICHVGETGSALRRTDTAPFCWPLNGIVSFGLSVIFTRQHEIVFRRYAPSADIVLM